VSKWADIDARPAGEIAATTIVAGIPLFIRPLRQLARQGWAHARVLVGDDQQAETVWRCLRLHPVPHTMAVEVVRADKAGSGAALTLSASAIYLSDDLAAAHSAGTRPAAAIEIRQRSDMRAAEHMLYARIRKSVDADGLFAHYLIRPLTVPLTRMLLGTRVSPNQVTITALLAGLCAAACAADGTRSLTITAGLLYWLGNAIDCIDGDLARLRLQSSKMGEWLDSMTDEISTFTLLAGLGVGLWHSHAGREWLILGLAGSVVGALTVARLYLELHRRRMPIDSAQFPWFFQDAGAPKPDPPGAPASLLGRVGRLLTFLVRRDANVTIVAALLIVDLRQWAVALMALGIAFGAALTVVHFVVMARRRVRA